MNIFINILSYDWKKSWDEDWHVNTIQSGLRCKQEEEIPVKLDDSW